MATERIVYIDQLKSFLTCLVVAHHAAQAYGPSGGVWVVNDSEKADWLRSFFFVNASFMMGLYFFISGYFTMASLGRKTASQFISDRMKRLGIPLLVFIFFVFLPFNYFSSATEMSIGRFFIYTWFNKPPLATGHLWFLASLLVYSLLLILIPNKGKRETVKTTLNITSILLYILLLTLLTTLVRTKYPIDHWETWGIPVEVAHIPQYLSLFLAGAFFRQKRLLETLTNSTGFLFAGMAVIAITIKLMFGNVMTSYIWTEPLIESVICVGISLGLLVIFRKFANRSGRFAGSISANAYGIYLFHLFIVIGLQLLMVTWDLPATLKFLVVSIAAILISHLLTTLVRKSRRVAQII